MRITGEPVSIMNLIRLLLTTSDAVKNGGPFFPFVPIEWIFIKLNQFRQVFSHLPPRCKSFPLLYGLFFVMSGTIWGNFQLRRTLRTSFSLFGPVGCLASGTDYFSGFHVPVCLFSGEFYFSVYEMPNFFPSSVSSKSFKFSYMYSCMASTDM